MPGHKARKRTGRAENRKKSANLPRLAEKAAKAFELPVDLVAGVAHFEFSGNREVVVEGCRGILDYDENIITIDMGKMPVRFMGRGLELRSFTDHSCIIDGFVLSVEFLE